MAAAPKKADDAKKNKDSNADEENTGSPAASGSKKKLFLLIGVAVLLVAISVGGTIGALKLMSPSDDEEAEDEEVAEEVVPLAPAIYFQMTPNFTINFNINGRQRFLQAEVTLMYRDPVLEPVLKLHMPAIRNGLVMLFSNKNFDELQTPEGKENLRKEAFDTIQGILMKEQEATAPKSEEEDEEEDEDKKDKKKNKKSKEEEKPKFPGIEQVLFTNFVMQ